MVQQDASRQWMVCILSFFFIVLMAGAILFYFTITQPISIADYIALVLGGIGAAPFIWERVRYWDVRAWEWRDRPEYPLTAYKFAWMGGPIGIVLVHIGGSLLGKDLSGLLFVACFGTFVVLLFGWSFIESIQSLYYYYSEGHEKQ